MKEKRARIFRLLPIIVVSAILPFVLHYHETPTRLTEYSWFSNEDMISDIHFYYRAVLFLVMAAYMAVVLVCDGIHALSKRKAKQKGKKASNFLAKWKASVPFIPLAVYLFMAFLSSILSEVPEDSFTMFYQMFETVWILLGYAVCAYYIFFYLENEGDVRVVLRGMSIATTIMSVLGICQMKGIHVFSVGIFRWIVYPWNAVLEENTQVSDRIANTAEMTFGNANFAGGYIALIFPIIVLLLLDAFSRKYTKDKSGKILIFDRIWYSILLVLLGINLYGTKTSSVVIALAAAFVIFVVFYRKRLHLKGWMLGGLAGVAVIGAVVFNVAKDGIITNKINEFLGSGDFKPALQAIEVLDDGVEITYNGEKMIIKLDANEDFSWYEFHVTDQNGAEIAYHMDENEALIYNVDDPRFPGIQYTAFQAMAGEELVKGIEVFTDGNPWHFVRAEDGKYYYLTRYLKLDKIANPKRSPLLEGKELMMSHRGYIWSLTLPLLKDYVILGEGANSFFRVFPNNDYVQTYNLGDSYKFIDKAHNLYLQQFIQVGGIGFVAFMVFFIWYLCSCCRLYFNSEYKTWLERIGLGCMLGIIGYLVFGFTNDSILVLAPFFWCVVGIGMAVNYLVKVSVKTLEKGSLTK